MQAILLEASPKSIQPTSAERAEEHELTVVMPCLNEAKTVGRCVAKAMAALNRLGVDGEVIVADNGSTDGSQDIARAHGARVVAAQRRGYGAALQAGIAGANSKFIIVGDADDSYDFSRIDPFVERLRQGDDLVMGNRFRGGILPGAMPWMHRYLGNPILTGILNLFYRSPIGDAHCGLRGFRKDSCLRLRLDTPGMEFASEMVVKACLAGQRMSEVPTVLHPDGRDRPPHLRSFRDGWRHLRFLLLFCPLWLYLIPAIAMGALGALLMLGSTLAPQTMSALRLGPSATMLGTFLILSGYQTAWFWCYARARGSPIRSSPEHATSRLFSWLNLERCLCTGGAMVLAALGLFGFVFYQSDGAHASMFRMMAALRLTLWGCTLLALGLQTAFGGFFLATLRTEKQ